MIWGRKPSLRSRSIPSIGRTPRWSIGIYTGDSPFTLGAPANVFNPVITANDVSDMRARFVADPFMIHHQGCWYMFFEALDAKTGDGKIACARSSEGLVWSYDKVVLNEPFHLSYPYTFTWSDQVYMVPESAEAKAVRLYRATEFPLQWEFAGNLLAGSDYVDSSLVHYSDRWWLFTVSNPARDRLRLFGAQRIEGPWNEHPRSPIVNANPHLARPGGRVFEHEGKLFRYAQDDFPWYGRQVWALEITTLTDRDYAERLVSEGPILRGSGFGWNADGMHHVDPHLQSDNRWIACVDGHRNTLSFGLWRL
jgi:hypothetical protein